LTRNADPLAQLLWNDGKSSVLLGEGFGPTHLPNRLSPQEFKERRHQRMGRPAQPEWMVSRPDQPGNSSGGGHQTGGPPRCGFRQRGPLQVPESAEETYFKVCTLPEVG